MNGVEFVLDTNVVIGLLKAVPAAIELAERSGLVLNSGSLTLADITLAAPGIHLIAGIQGVFITSTAVSRAGGSPSDASAPCSAWSASSTLTVSGAPVSDLSASGDCVVRNIDPITLPPDAGSVGLGDAGQLSLMVPEPTRAASLLAGLLGLGVALRRRRAYIVCR